MQSMLKAMGVSDGPLILVRYMPHIYSLESPLKTAFFRFGKCITRLGTPELRPLGPRVFLVEFKGFGRRV